MSLEAAINANTEAVNKLVAMLSASGITVSQVAADGKSGKTTHTPPAAAPEKPKDATPAAKSAEAAPTYDDTKKIVLELSAKKGRDAAVKALADVQPGAKTLVDVKPENYSRVIEAAKKALAA